MNPHIKRMLRKIVSPIRRLGLKNRDFSIISNNCWGGYIYDCYGMKYLTPTIGLYFSSSDYIKFISNLKYYLTLDLVEMKELQSKCKVNGKLGDIVIHFLHYDNFKEAKVKWEKRKKRINFSNLIIKMNDQNGCTLDDFSRFKELEYENKLFFTCNKSYIGDFVVYFNNDNNGAFLKDDIKSSKKYINIKKYLNKINSR